MIFPQISSADESTDLAVAEHVKLMAEFLDREKQMLEFNWIFLKRLIW